MLVIMEYLMSYSILNAHLKAAKAYAEFSKATKLKVGALVIRDRRPIVVGINGMPAGGSNECEEMINGELETKPEVSHAEENAILFSAREGISLKDCIMIVTHSPCIPCARMIIGAGITHVYYEKDYGSTPGIELLKQYNVGVGIINGES